MNRHLTFALISLALIPVCALTVYADDADKPGRVRLTNQTENQGSTGQQDRSVPAVIGAPDGQSSGSASLNGNSNSGNTTTSMPSAFTLDRSFLAAENNALGLRLIESPFRPRIRFDQRAGGQQGYDKGYTNLGLFLPFQVNRNELYFLDGRGIITGDGQGGANVGFGVRQYDPNRDAVRGISVWWDYDDGAEDTYHQLGLSYSHVTRYWRFRVNGYFITSDPNRILSQTPTGGIGYESIFIVQSVISREETAYSGVDAEIGAPMPFLGQYGFNWYAGLYYNEGKGNKDGMGVRGNIEAQITEDWSMGASISDDPVFGTNAQIDIQYTFPNGFVPSRWFRQAPIYEYMARADRRRYRVNTKRSAFVKKVPLTNPADGAPFRIAHIIPAAVQGVTPSGDGSIENPFVSLQSYNNASLAARRGFDMILVRGGDGLGTNLGSGINIFENQRLLAASRTHTFVASEGLFTLPETGIGLTPILSNQFEDLDGDGMLDPGEDFDGDGVLDLGGPVVTIDGSFAVPHDVLTEVSGFTIDGANNNTANGGPFNDGIISINAPITGFNINNNTIQNTLHATNLTHTGLLFEDVDLDGTLDTVNEDVDGDGRLDVAEDLNGNGLLDPGEDLDGDSNLDVAEDIDGDGNLDIVEDIDLDGVLDVGAVGLYVNNTLNGANFDSNSGLTINHTTETLRLVFDNNTLTNIQGEDADGSGILDLVNEDTNGNGILDVGEDLDGDGNLDVAEDNNGNGVLDLGNGLLVNANMGNLVATVTNNTMTNQGGNAFEFNVTSGMMDVDLSNNTVTGATGSGAILNITNGMLMGSIENNNFTSIGQNGVGNGLTVNADNSIVDFNDQLNNTMFIRGNTIDGAADTGMLFTSTNNSTYDLWVTGNTISGAGNKGIDFAADSGTAFVGIGGDLVTEGNSISTGGDVAIDIRLTGSAIALLDIENNTLATIGGPVTFLAENLGDPVFRAGFNANNLPANDDLSTALVPIGFAVNFLGLNATDLFVNNNGNLTFNSDLFTFTPDPIITNGLPIIAPFWADVDTRAGNIVTFGNGTVNGQQAFAANWDNVRFFDATDPANAATTNRFQVVLIDRSDINPGDFDIEFNYTDINWESGTASLGDTSGLGGDSARVGLSNGSTFSIELPGSAVNGAFLNSGPAATSLINNSLNSILDGRYRFAARNGGIGSSTGTETGIRVTASDTAQLQTAAGNSRIANNTIDGFGNTGISIAANNNANIMMLDIEGNQTNGGGTGISLTRNDSAMFSTNLQGNTVSVPGANGILITGSGDNSSVFDVNLASGNIIDTPGESGLVINASGDVIIDVDDDNTTITSPGTDAVSITQMDNSNVIFNQAQATVTDATANAINIDLQDASFLNATISGSSYSNSGGFGLFLNSINNSDFSLTVGGPNTTDLVTFDGAVDAGIGLNLENSSGDTTGNSLFVDNVAITNVTDGANTDFNGDGIRLLMTNSARLTDAVIGDATDRNTTISDTAGAAISVETSGVSAIVANAGTAGLTIQNVDASTNAGNGFEFARFNDSQFQNVLMIGNVIDTPGVDGIDIQGFGGNVNALNPPASPFVNVFNIGTLTAGQGNTITDAGVNGIDILASADAFLDVNILGNTITTPATGDGIEADTEFDARLTGTWDGNTITQAAVDGVSINLINSSGTGTGQNLNINNNTITQSGRDGARFINNVVDLGTGDDLTVGFNGNTITSSTANGITVQGNLSSETRFTTFNQNIVTGNTGDGLNVAVTSDAAVRINSAVGNNFSRNTGDGVDLSTQGNNAELVVATTGDGTAATAVVDNATSGFVDNTVTFNGGAGFRINNLEDGETVVRIAGTVNPVPTNGAAATAIVAENGSNGILLLSGANNQNGQTPILRAQLLNLAVTGNGRDTTLTNDERNGIWIQTGTSAAGFSVYDVRQNFLSGNQNLDFVVDTFVSTPDPVGGAADPLARTYLLFRNNRGDQVDVTRIGATYNNANAQKSPLRFYGSTARLRNATKVAATLDDFSTYNGLPAPYNFDDGFVTGGGAAATTTQFNTTLNVGTNYTNGEITLTPGGQRNITNTGVNNGDVRLTVAPALGAAPAPVTPFSIDWNNIAGIGESTLITADVNLAAGGNVFATVLSDFDDTANIAGGTAIGSVYGDFAADGIFNGNFQWSVATPPPNPGVVFPGGVTPLFFP